MQQLRVKLAFVLTAAMAGSLGAQAQNCPVGKPGLLPLKFIGGPTVSSITACDLMNRLYKYADDSMMGRQYGSEYNIKSTAYIEAEVRRLGLVPAGDSGGYFQNVGLPINFHSLDAASTITVDGKTLHAGVEFVANAAGRPIQVANAQVVNGGLANDTANVLSAEQVQGKLILMRPGAPLRFTSQAEFNAYQQTPGVQAYQKMLAAAAGVINVVTDRAFAVNSKTLLSPTRPGAATAARDVKIAFLVTEATAEQLLGTPIASAAKGAAGKTVTSDVHFIDRAGRARNVVAVLPGSDPKLKGQYIAIGAHNDHVGYNNGSLGESDSLKVWGDVAHPAGAEGGRTTPITEAEWTKINADIATLRGVYPARPDSIFNGADDDGSGSVSVLEIAEAFAKGSVKPKRSIIFVWHTGEESGMLGSGYFMDHPTVPRDSIVAQLNIDMVGRGAATDITGQAKAPQDSTGRFTGNGAELRGGDRYVQLVGSRRLSTELGDLVEKVNTDKKHGFKFDYNIDADGHQQNIYCRSDHWSYGKWGVPVVFFTTGGHADYHQVTDEPQYIRYEHMAAVDSLIFDIAVSAANLDHRVVVDKAKPNPAPATACKQ